MPDVKLGRLFVTLEGQDVGLTKLLNAARTEMRAASTDAGGATLSMARVLPAVGALTIGMQGLRAAFDLAKEGFNIRSQLDENRRSVQTLVGDVERGNNAFQVAAEFGRKYGFTQQEMGEAAANAAPLIRNSTTAIEKQFEVLGRLAARNQREGFSGAVFSAGELASGDITSIVERFNLSRDAARRMKEEIAAGADVFAVLDRELTQLGMTQEVLENRTKGTAGAQRELAQAHEDLALALGQFVEGPGTAFLQWLAQVERGGATVVNAVRSATTIGDQAQHSGALALQAAQSYEEYGNKIIWVNQQLDQAGLYKHTIAALTEAQYNLAQSYIATGMSADEAQAKVQGMTSAEVQQAQAALQAMEIERHRLGEVTAGAAATDTSTAAIQTNAQALLDHLTKTISSAQATQQFNAAQQMLASLGGAVAQGLMTPAAAALQLANAYGIAYQEAYKLIAAQAALAQAQMNTDALRDQRAGERDAGSGRSFAQIQAQADRERLDAAARRESEFLRMSREQQAAHLRQQAAQLREGSAERIRLEDRAWQIEQTLQTRGGAAKVASAGKLNNQLLDAQTKYHDDTEDREREYYDRLLDIQSEHERKSAEQARRNEVSKRQSRADFYDQIADLEAQGIDTSKFQAEYEAAFQQSQELAQQGQRRLAEERLAMRQRQIQEMEDYAREEQDLQENEDLSKSEKQRQLAALEQRRALRQEAHAEELKQLEVQGDAINNELQTRLAEEGERYREATDEAAQRYEDLADRRIAAHQRANGVIAGLPPAELNQARQVAPTDGPSAEPATPQGNPLTDAINSQTSTLSGGLAEVRDAVSALGPKLDSINRSVGNIRVSSGGALQ